MGLTLGCEEEIPHPRIARPKRPQAVHLGRGDAAVQVGADVVRLGRWAVVHVYFTRS